LRIESETQSQIKDYPKSKIQNPKSRVLWLEGRCLEFRQATSYWPFIDLLQSYLALCSEEFQVQPDCLVSVLQGLIVQGHLSPERFEEITPLLGNMPARIRSGTRHFWHFMIFWWPWPGVSPSSSFLRISTGLMTCPSNC
jgi:hypothetical protein